MSARVYVQAELEQLLTDQNGGLYFGRMMLLSCGCRVEVDARHIQLLGHPGDYKQIVLEMLESHECEPASRMVGYLPPAVGA